MDRSTSVARWSRGMICASDARGPGFKSRTSPKFLCDLSFNGEKKSFEYSKLGSIKSLKTSLKHANGPEADESL